MTEIKTHAWMDLICLICGAILLGHNFGWEIGLAVGLLTHTLRPQIRSKN